MPLVYIRIKCESGQYSDNTKCEKRYFKKHFEQILIQCPKCPEWEVSRIWIAKDRFPIRYKIPDDAGESYLIEKNHNYGATTDLKEKIKKHCQLYQKTDWTEISEEDIPLRVWSRFP